MPDYQFWHLVGHNSKLSGLFSCTQEPLFKAHNGLHCVTLDFYLLSIDFMSGLKIQSLSLIIISRRGPKKGLILALPPLETGSVDICVLVPVN